MGVIIREKPPKSGVYWLFVNHRGRRTSQKIGRNQKRAQELAEEIRHQLAMDKLGLLKKSENKILFYDYAKSWADSYIKQLRSLGTYTRYSKLLDQHIRPLIGSIPLSELARRDIREALLKYMRTGASKSSVGIMHCVISGALNHAVDDELIESNPAAGLVRKLALDDHNRKEIKPMSTDEVAAVLAIIAEHWPLYYPAFLTLFRTGIRLGEMCALKWQDVNFHDKQLSIHRTARDQVITNKTKTSRSGRRVDISDQLCQVLKNIQKEWQKNNIKSGGKKRNLVYQLNNKLLPQNTIRRIFNRALERAGLDRRRIHDIRHTYASILLTSGTPIIYVKEQMGHTSIKTTVDIYGHLLPSVHRHAVNTLDDQKNTGYKGKLRRR